MATDDLAQPPDDANAPEARPPAPPRGSSVAGFAAADSPGTTGASGRPDGPVSPPPARASEETYAFVPPADTGRSMSGGAVAALAVAILVLLGIVAAAIALIVGLVRGASTAGAGLAGQVTSAWEDLTSGWGSPSVDGPDGSVADASVLTGTPLSEISGDGTETVEFEDPLLGSDLLVLTTDAPFTVTMTALDADGTPLGEPTDVPLDGPFPVLALLPDGQVDLVASIAGVRVESLEEWELAVHDGADAPQWPSAGGIGGSGAAVVGPPPPRTRR